MKFSAALLLIIILNFGVLCAQDQLKIDSLTLNLSDVNSDIELIDLYNEIAHEYRKTDSVQTATYSNKAIELAKKLNYSEGISDAYLGLAGAAKYAGHYEEALEMFNKALDSAPSSDLKRKGEARNGLASISRRQGNYPQALE